MPYTAQFEYYDTPEERDALEAAEAALRRQERASHDCVRSACGPVCTFGQW